jgi:hypothetical protein
LKSVEGHFLVGFGDGSLPVLSAEPIDVLPNAAAEARAVLAEHPATRARIERVLALSEGYESAYAMELLSTVHWVVTEQGADGFDDPELAARLVAEWSPRKQRMFGPDHVTTAWNHLHDGGWLRAAVTAQ